MARSECQRSWAPDRTVNSFGGSPAARPKGSGIVGWSESGYCAGVGQPVCCLVQPDHRLDTTVDGSFDPLALAPSGARVRLSATGDRLALRRLAVKGPSPCSSL